MDDLYGIPLAIDVGTLLGLLGGGAVVGGIARRIRDRAERDQRAERERLEQKRETEQRRLLLLEEQYRTHKEALEIHESLTSLEVLEAMGRVRASQTDQVAREFLLASYRRGQRRYLAFRVSTELTPALETLIGEALTGIAAIFPEDLKEEQSAFERRQRRRANDTSQYSWEGVGRHSKIWTINLIAQRWASTHGHTSRSEFEESFGAELRDAVPQRADEYQTKWLLTQQVERHIPELLLELDGQRYGVHWRCGFKNEQVGVEVHRPVIGHFRDVHGFPASRL